MKNGLFEEKGDRGYYEDGRPKHTGAIKEGEDYKLTKKTPAKKKKALKISIIITSVLLVLVIAGLCFWNYLFGGLKHVDIDRNNLGITEQLDKVEGIVSDNAANLLIKNIVVFGMSISKGGGFDEDRSDMNLVVSIDPTHNRVCLTSILRDSKVMIPDYGPQKINIAYRWGGPELAIKTINQNFHLNIADYITVNFENLIEIVDSLGGVDIELTEEESTQVHDTVPGINHLDGDQAKEYASIRKIDSDYYRASRQQNIIMALLKKIKSMPKSSYPETIHNLMGCFETSLEFSDLMDIANSLDLSTATIVRNNVPDQQYETDLWGGFEEDTGLWFYKYDLEKASARIHRIIYDLSEDGAEN